MVGIKHSIDNPDKPMGTDDQFIQNSIIYFQYNFDNFMITHPRVG